PRAIEAGMIQRMVTDLVIVRDEMLHLPVDGRLPLSSRNLAARALTKEVRWMAGGRKDAPERPVVPPRILRAKLHPHPHHGVRIDRPVLEQVELTARGIVNGEDHRGCTRGNVDLPRKHLAHRHRSVTGSVEKLQIVPEVLRLP